MIEEVLPDIYRVGIPLPRNPLKELNSYVVKGSGRTLIVDTGMNREECKSAMDAGLAELGVDLNETDFFITHLHADHAGLLSQLLRDGSTAYCSELDARRINGGPTWDKQMELAVRNGFPEEEVRQAIERHPGFQYGMKRHIDFAIAREGTTISAGRYNFQCVETPGHTMGHVCLYEASTKTLFSGDHILIDITPNIALWNMDSDHLGNYLSSLDKIYQYDVAMVLPGHRRLISDHRARILELKEHHRVRANEVVTILEKGPQSGYQIAAQMTWDFKADRWEDFPVSQKWFATGEALSHIKWLEGKGRLRSVAANGRVMYALP